MAKSGKPSYVWIDERISEIEAVAYPQIIMEDTLARYEQLIPIVKSEEQVAKAIKVTKENHVKLEQQFNLEPDYLLQMLETYMLVVFGFEQVEGYLSFAALDRQFRKVRDLENGWFEVAPRD